ncbi:MAG TPA: uracil-DNA glycosylase, partial [Firmicutes bacterium]|nr:uracil-DNA glycosylase [Bacillota bacterium]
IILVGSYGQRYYLGSRCRGTLTETVRSFRDYLPRYLPLVHPSPRNTAWLKQNPWFEREVLPVLREITTRLLEL